MLRSLVGSEMCIRDRIWEIGTEFVINIDNRQAEGRMPAPSIQVVAESRRFRFPFPVCLLYTSDAADDLLCVDLGGRRILKKKKYIRQTNETYTTLTYKRPHYQ